MAKFTRRSHEHVSAPPCWQYAPKNSATVLRARDRRWRYASGVMPSTSAAVELSTLNMVPST